MTKIFLILFLISSLPWTTEAQTYIQGPALIEGLTSVASAGATSTLTSASQTVQALTGASNQNFVLPDATTLQLGRRFEFKNGSTGSLVVKDGGASTLITLIGGQSLIVRLSAKASAAGTWKLEFPVIDLTSTAQAVGTLPIVSGGTNSAASLNNNRMMQSSGGAIIEAAGITAARALISDANGIPTQSVTTSAELAFVNGVTSSIQTQLNGKQATGNYITDLTGDVTASGPGSSAATIANLAVTNAKIANSTIDLTAKVTGILPNANTTATSANTASAVVARGVSGDFSAGTITASLTGTASGNLTLASPVNHGILLSGAANATSALGVGATGTILQGNTGANPSFSTATYPSTTTAPCTLISNTSNAVTCLAATVANKVLLTTDGSTLSMAAISLDTAQVTNNLPVNHGGSGAATFTNHGVLVGAGTSAFTALGVGSTGQVLLGSTGADPSFGSLTVANLPNTLGYYAAYISAPSGGACAVSREMGSVTDWINGNASSPANGRCTITVNTGICSSTPVCTGTVFENSANTRIVKFGNASSTQIESWTSNGVDAAVNLDYMIQCICTH